MPVATLVHLALTGLFVLAQGDAFADFKARLNAYAELRAGVQRELGLNKAPSESAAELGQGAHRLAEGIRKARHDALRAAIFTAATEAALRAIVKPVLDGPDGPAILKTIGDDLPPAFKLEVNGEYPDAHAFATVPIDLLLRLPSLPADLEYRFVPRHLLLFDSRASLILDYIQIY